jgi:hypothetical protein
MENYLQKYKSIDAIYTADDDMLMGALQAYRNPAAGLKGGRGRMKELVKKIMDDSDLIMRRDLSAGRPGPGGALAVVGVKARFRRLPEETSLHSSWPRTGDQREREDYTPGFAVRRSGSPGL